MKKYDTILPPYLPDEEPNTERDSSFKTNEWENVPFMKKNNLGIYPNPANNAVTISATIPDAAELNITVYNILGQEIYADRVSADVYVRLIETKQWQSGIYTVKIKSEGKEKEIGKFSVAH